MSLYEDERYSWRETYFVLFDPAKRPMAMALRREIRAHAGTFRILDMQAEPGGELKSMTIASYEDHSALEITYREGEAVVGETHALLEMLEKGCTPKERERLYAAKNYRARFDILHFEQTAGTAAFKILKMPDLRFAKKDPTRGAFPKSRPSDKLTDTNSRFHFDPDSYENCRTGGHDSDWEEPGPEDSSILERLDPNTLVLVLEILCRASGGIAIDPASGVVI